MAPRPSASLAWADSAPKLMPAMVIGISSSIGFLAKRVPSTVWCRTSRGSPRADSATARRRGTADRRNAAPCAWRPAADLVDAGRGGALDVVDRCARSKVADSRVGAAAGGSCRRTPSVGVRRCRCGSGRAARAEPSGVNSAGSCRRCPAASSRSRARRCSRDISSRRVGAERCRPCRARRSGLVQRIAERVAGVAADHQVPAWAMNADKSPTLPAPRCRCPSSRCRSAASVAFDDQQPAVAGAPADAGVALDAHRARHHVLGHARPGVAVHASSRCWFMPAP